MPPYKLRVAFPLIFLLTVQYSIAAVKLPALFSDHMVLQREMRLPIWGTAGPGESIAVHIGNLSAQTIADTKGKWKVWIDPMRAGGPYEIVITGKDTTIISNVLVGEVWVCSGQSNMALEVKNCLDPETETASAQYPEIRHFQVKRTKAASALEDLVHFENGSSSWLNSWEICDPSTVGHFSGSAYFFARELYKKINVPVGIIHASWGGTTAEAWTPLDTLESDPILGAILEDWPLYNNDEEWLAREYEVYVQEVKKARGENRREPLYFNQPAVLFNGMIAPVIPYGIRGVLWYQGESNAYRAYQYRDLFPAMITQWRKKWGQGDFPFLFVQLANYHFEPQVFPELREAQSLALKLPATGMAVAIDIGDSADIHPGNKQEVGRRLALCARKIAFQEDLVFSGPLFKKMFIEENRCWLLFDHVGDGLVAKGGGALKGFVIAGDDGEFLEARAIIDGDQVIVWHNQIEHPVSVRYAWANHPGACNLYNRSRDGTILPASPFRTDNQPGITCDREYGSGSLSDRLIGQIPAPEATVAAHPEQDGTEKIQLALSVMDTLEKNELYASTNELVNGVKWTFRKQYKGNPFLSEDYWPDATITYKGKQYEGYQVNYDLYAGDFILLYHDNDTRKYIVLSKEYLDSFSYTDTLNHKDHHFIYSTIPGTTRKALYEKIYEGRSSLIVEPVCDIRDDPSGNFPGVYNRNFDYFILIDGHYKSIHSKRSFFNLLDQHVPEVKKYIRKNRLKIGGEHPEGFVQVLKYLDTL